MTLEPTNKHYDQLVAEGAAQSAIEAHLENCDQCGMKAEQRSLESTAEPSGRPVPHALGLGAGRPRFVDPACLSDGTQFGPFHILKKLSDGGMGHVYQATRAHLGLVAIKFLRLRFSSNARVYEQFLAQASQMAQVAVFQNLVQVHLVGILTQNEVGTMEVLEYDPEREVLGVPFVQMEYVNGGSLSSIIGPHGIASCAAIRDLGCQIASGLRQIHGLAIVHRDIKPANILLVRDDISSSKYTAKVTDFGIDAHTTGYAAPEVTSGDPVDRRADLFSLGVTLFEMCTGSRPESTDQISVRKALSRSHCGRCFAEVISRLLQSKPIDRYQSAKEVYEALEKLECKDGPPPWLWLLAALLFAVGILCAWHAQRIGPQLDTNLLTLPEQVDGVVVDEIESDGETKLPGTPSVKSDIQAKTELAWTSFKRGERLHNERKSDEAAPELRSAINHALVVVRFKGDAARMQSRLVRSEPKPPPVGQVPPETRDQLMKRGQLNDVAVCLWIIGRSAEYLEDYESARVAYQQARKLTYGRAWDPEQSAFWPPSVRADDDLTTLDASHPARPRWPYFLASILAITMGTGLGVVMIMSHRRRREEFQ